MSAVAQADSTYAAIERKVRKLTSSPTSQTLLSSTIQQYVNTIYSQDFPYGIKLDQMRNIYTFFTVPYQDRYPLDVNYNQGVRAPVYFDGIQGAFYKDRQQLYNLFPRWPTQFQQSDGISGSISGATRANPAVLTSAPNGLIAGSIITISNVQGMTQLNGNTYTVLSTTSTTITIDVDSSGFSVYTSGGSWSSSTAFNFFVNPVPFLRGEVTIGGTYQSTGSSFSISDQLNPITNTPTNIGNLYLQDPNPQTAIPSYSTDPTSAGMRNLNTGNPGQNIPRLIGTVNYVTGQMQFNLPQSLQSGTHMTIWVDQYSTGRPYTLLFWNNEFYVRPIPKLVHKVEVETYLTPVQFLQTNDNPILNQWWQYLAYLTAAEIMRDRNDFEMVAMLQEGAKRQEYLVLERQGIEEIGQRNSTIFASAQNDQGWNQFWSLGGWN